VGLVPHGGAQTPFRSRALCLNPMKPEKADPTATPKRKKIGYRFALIGLGEHVHNTTLAVLPDHHRTDSRRWQKAKERGVIVRNRSDLARGFRKWRAKGFHAKKGRSPFTSLIAWLIVEAVHDRIEIPAGKEAARA